MNELLTPSEMAEADRLTIAGGTAGLALMERAGRAVADTVIGRFPSGKRVTVVAGPGNNGGDGFVAARLLAEHGYRVTVMLVGDPARLKGDAALAAKKWRGEITADSGYLATADVLIDALFGAGLDRPIEGAVRALIETMNALATPIVAVDLPSGINGATGAVMGVRRQVDGDGDFLSQETGSPAVAGPAALRRDFGRRHRHSGVRSGAHYSCDLRERSCVWRAQFPIPKLDGHKYDRGHAVVVSGPSWSTGAARLAARGALRAGAGLVTIASPREALAVNAADNLAIMVRPVDGSAELAVFLSDKRLNALAIGPGVGVGPQTCELVLAALSGERSVVLDADAMTSFADNPQQLASALKARSANSTVMTPHEGEFSRYFGALDGRTKAGSKLEQARLAAELTGAVIVLKGADTVVAGPGGRAAISANAPAYLATAGAGDVLAGMVTGLLAQGMPAFEAAAAAVWLHGEAASAFGPGLISEDLPEQLPRLYRRLFC